MLNRATTGIPPTILWIGCGSCSGESMAMLGVDGQATGLIDLLEHDGVRLLWHPSLSLDPLAPIVHQILDGVFANTAVRRRLHRDGARWHGSLRHL